MKINWKVRLKNPVVWLTLIPTFVAFVYAVLMALGIVPSISESVVTDALTAIVTALAALGILNDPTTAGVNDSERAMEYEKPKEDETNG